MDSLSNLVSDPMVAQIAMSLGQGLFFVGQQVVKKAVDKGVAEPIAEVSTDKLRKLIKRGQGKAANDAAVREAIAAAFAAIDAPVESEAFAEYAINFGYDQLQAENNDELREEFARAMLLVTEPDGELVPDRLVQLLRWPPGRRDQLAAFLFSLRQYLYDHPEWGPLVKYSQMAAGYVELRRMATSMVRVEAGFAQLLKGLDISTADDETALREYIDHVLVTTANVAFVPVNTTTHAQHRQKAEAPLEAVFVPLQVQDPDQLRTGHDRLHSEALPEERDELSVVTINDVLERYPVFLLRGKPGSGKTTLLRHLARSFAAGEAADTLAWSGDPLLPILVPLRNFGRFLQDNRQTYPDPAPLALLRYMESYFREHLVDLPRGFFKKRLDNGHCLVLLDGLDEVADKELRATVSQFVTGFVHHFQARGNRFGMSSRPKGFDEVAAYLARPVVCNVEDLLPDGRDELVRNLLRQLEDDPYVAEQQANNLIHGIQLRRPVDKLSRNPLFCTTLVLVFKYAGQGARLPERRVDVYQEVVSLLLGRWEQHRRGVADARELVVMDGTGRSFLSEDDAIEAKSRALIDLADWMQREVAKAEVDKELAVGHLSGFFETQGAKPDEREDWARGFLDVAHQRSGLFVELEPDVCGFSHQHFREFLAATALVEQPDAEITAILEAHAGDSWWEEVIKLAAAHNGFGKSSLRREMFFQSLLDNGHLVLAGQCAIDAGGRLPIPRREQIQEMLRERMIDPSFSATDRFAAGETLDALGWLPPDLNEWVRCPAAASDGGDLLVARYPVTNAQYELFIRAGGYKDPAYWGGEGSNGWRWRSRQDEKGFQEPQYWQHGRLGRDRRGFPVVGVSWYEADAYCAWLASLLERVAQEDDLTPDETALIAQLLVKGGGVPRLLREEEWVRAAGGDEDDRFPWQAPGIDQSTEADFAANIYESKIGGTSPVAMWPDGASHPNQLMDMAGNVWEWTNSWYDSAQTRRVLRGGSWYYGQGYARVASRSGYNPDSRNRFIGFRVAAPVVSGS